MWHPCVGGRVAKVISAVAVGVFPLELNVDGAVLKVVVERLKLKSVIVVAIVVTFVALKDKRSECCIV